MDVRVIDDEILVGDQFRVAFQRTLRVPSDGQEYPLPPGLGRLPIRAVSGLGLAIPLYQREALWLAFDGAEWRPNAAQIGVGSVNAISGAEWSAELRDDPQNYVVVPDQLWLDGINSGAGTVRQFVALPLGTGRTVEGQVTGRETVGTIGIRVFEPKPGRFPDHPPPLPTGPPPGQRFATGAMGVSPGGHVRQRIRRDAYGVATWDPSTSTEVVIHLVNTEMWSAATGEAAPPTPVDARSYTEAGLPWFERYEETAPDVAAPQILQQVQPLNDPEPSLAVRPEQVREIGQSDEH